MSDEQMINWRLKALEIAERSVHAPYIYGGVATPGADLYRDKDMGEILNRARRMLRFVLDEDEDNTQGLIAKLKTALCQE